MTGTSLDSVQWNLSYTDPIGPGSSTVKSQSYGTSTSTVEPHLYWTTVEPHLYEPYVDTY